MLRLPFAPLIAACLALMPCVAAQAHDPHAATADASAGATAAPIEIVLPDARVVALTDVLLGKVARHALTATAHGKTSTYEGRDFVEVLKVAGVQPVESLEGPQLRTLVTVIGRDGYQVVFALAELDPTIGGRQVMFADRADGAALDARDGPWQLVVPEDQRPARWIRQIARIVVSNAGS
ncbi:hypothetical protein [Agrilutibacter solisilvae]|uniref:Molybdopterin-binding protein n=1 Tax=Agrilutibacter solisilvae TaxID=2763317 RepID=A0A974XXQ6_9GAMM|nr:hypothetical protein [Lysobacter solisilvae]QSX77706.1 hypothetical protein I8J32_013305 [Lysobacter solisilvae]